MNVTLPDLKKAWIIVCRRYAYQVHVPQTTIENRITVPQSMIRKLDRLKRKRAARSMSADRSFKNRPVVIACRKPEMNHHQGQMYSNFKPQLLASYGWKNRNSKGDFFTINAFTKNPSQFSEDEAEVSSFAGFGLRPALIDGINAMGISVPTKIQAQTIPHMLEGSNVLCAAETGSGKTLAYLLPIIEQMKRQEELYELSTEPNKPRCVILSPSRELADQIYAVAEKLQEYLPFSTEVICGGRGTKSTIRQNRGKVSVDIAITTPGTMKILAGKRYYDLSAVQWIVLDEADTLLDDSFNSLTKEIIQKMKVHFEKVEGATNPLTGSQIAFVSATLPRKIHSILENVVPLDSLVKVTTPHLHRLMTHVPQKFIRTGQDDKPELLLRNVKNNAGQGIPTIVFANRNSTSFWISHFLQTNNVHHVLFNGVVGEQVRHKNLEMFQEGEVDLLICTDLASRGLDTIRAKCVINYEFPEFIADYIHRVGRVGRVGAKGSDSVINFVTYKWDVELLWQIEAATRKVTEFFNVNANIKKSLKERIKKDPTSLNDV